MYVSCLLIDVGSNPDRPRPGRLWLRNRYRVHQRLCMAFPSAMRSTSDPEFLQPYAPGDFPEDRYLADRAVGEVDTAFLRHVHAKRNARSGFLFRVDPLSGGRVAILVVSALKPAWDYAFHNASYLLAAPPSEPRPFDVSVHPKDKLHFRLVANPTKKLATLAKVDRRAKVPGRHGRRVPVPSDEASLRSWLERRAERAGFAVVQLTSVQCGYLYVNKNAKNGDGQRLRSALYDGLLTVTNAELFRRALESGVGPAKAFGCGLLSVRAVR